MLTSVKFSLLEISDWLYSKSFFIVDSKSYTSFHQEYWPIQVLQIYQILLNLHDLEHIWLSESVTFWPLLLFNQESLSLLPSFFLQPTDLTILTADDCITLSTLQTPITTFPVFATILVLLSNITTRLLRCVEAGTEFSFFLFHQCLAQCLEQSGHYNTNFLLNV